MLRYTYKPKVNNTLRSSTEFFKGGAIHISSQFHILFSSAPKFCLGSFSIYLCLPYTGSASLVSDRQCPCRLLIGYTPEDTCKNVCERLVGSNASWSDGILPCKYKQELHIKGWICSQKKIHQWVNRFCFNAVIFLYLKILCHHNSLVKYFISMVLIWN